MLTAETGAEGGADLIIGAPLGHRHDEVLSAPALSFIDELHRRFEGQRERVLRWRTERQRQFDAGILPNFLDKTRHVRDGDWTIAPIPAEMRDRRVEVIAAPERRMTLMALNSGARVFVADFEDTVSPTWANMIDGQLNLKDRWAGRLEISDSSEGADLRLGDDPAMLAIRPRGLHLDESNAQVDGAPVCAALFDFALYAFHNAKLALTQGSGPYIYLPKLESHLEARLWNDVFAFAEETLGLANGTIKATVQIETLPAVFEMDEILYELREHVVALHYSRWDQVFSFVKLLRNNADYQLPDRSALVMDKDFLGAASRLLVTSAHRRGALAIGGLAALVPTGDEQTDKRVKVAVAADHEREAKAGYDGAWVAHPDLVIVAKDAFDRLVSAPNQINTARTGEPVNRDQLLSLPQGAITEAGLRENIGTGVRFLANWLAGDGAVLVDGRLEDCAAAEIARTQTWQQLRHGACFSDGRTVTKELFLAVLDDEVARLRDSLGEEDFAGGRYTQAAQLFRDLALQKDFVSFLTLEAGKHLA